MAPRRRKPAAAKEPAKQEEPAQEEEKEEEFVPEPWYKNSQLDFNRGVRDVSIVFAVFYAWMALGFWVYFQHDKNPLPAQNFKNPYL